MVKDQSRLAAASERSPDPFSVLNQPEPTVCILEDNAEDVKMIANQFHAALKAKAQLGTGFAYNVHHKSALCHI
jgi:hypothetical protein